MATGTAGSTFTSELNRLANSGTYPVLTSYLTATAAANSLAGTSGKALIGALNLEADATLDKGAAAYESNAAALDTDAAYSEVGAYAAPIETSAGLRSSAGSGAPHARDIDDAPPGGART